MSGVDVRIRFGPLYVIERSKSYYHIDAAHSLPALKPPVYKWERVLKQATFLTNLTSLMPGTSEPICNI